MKHACLALALAAACSGGEYREPVRKPVTLPLPPGARPPPPEEVVAWVNNHPVTREAVLETTFSLDYKNTVDRHIAAVLVMLYVREHAIHNAPEEILERARRRVAAMKAQPGGALEAMLQRARITEEQYAQRLVDNGSTDALLLHEQATVYALLSGGFSRVDIALFGSVEEAERFARDPKSVRPARQSMDVRISPTLVPPSLGSRAVESIRDAKPVPVVLRMPAADGKTTALVTVLEHIEAQDASYEEIRPRVLNSIRARPPDPAELDMLVRHLFREADIRYDDRWHVPTE